MNCVVAHVATPHLAFVLLYRKKDQVTSCHPCARFRQALTWKSNTLAMCGQLVTKNVTALVTFKSKQLKSQPKTKDVCIFHMLLQNTLMLPGLTAGRGTQCFWQEQKYSDIGVWAGARQACFLLWLLFITSQSKTRS